MRSRILPALLLVGVAVAARGPTAQLQGASLGAHEAASHARQDLAAAGLDTAELERVEDLSESLANDLLELSVAARDRDEPRIASHFADPVVVVDFPLSADAASRQQDWLWRHAWETHPGTETLRRSDAVARLRGVLEHFDSIEDARFKVKGAEFETDRPAGRARVKMFVIGRNADGRREWLDSWMWVEARAVNDTAWNIDRIEVESIGSVIAERDLFSEVSLPAGLAVKFPDFGTPPNETVVAHGAAVGDVNGDGYVDLLATGVERNTLFLNRGDGRFDDVSDDTLIGLAPAATGAALLDADADGDLDLFLAAVGPQMYLENRLVPDGVLQFYDVSPEAGVDVEAIGFSVAVGDVNGDGRPDVYVTSYNRYGVVMPDSWHQASNGTPNLLFINLGGGRFREDGAAWGVRDSRWGYAAAFADVDGDVDQDLYVANDFGENALYVNDGGGFVDRASALGVLDPGNGMGAAFGDFDNDGVLDLHVTNMSSTAGNRILGRLFPEAQSDSSILKKMAAGNSLYRGLGDGTFEDVTQAVGGFSAGWAWGGGFVDFDNDGWEDIYAPNGFISGKTMHDT